MSNRWLRFFCPNIKRLFYQRWDFVMEISKKLYRYQINSPFYSSNGVFIEPAKPILDITIFWCAVFVMALWYQCQNIYISKRTQTAISKLQIYIWTSKWHTFHSLCAINLPRDQKKTHTNNTIKGNSWSDQVEFVCVSCWI